jgi:hypothetical protein
MFCGNNNSPNSFCISNKQLPNGSLEINMEILHTFPTGSQTNWAQTKFGPQFDPSFHVFFDKELCMRSSPFLGFFSREHKISFFACPLARSFVQEPSLPLFTSCRESLFFWQVLRVCVFL